VVETEYRTTMNEAAQRYFTCGHCGAKGEVLFVAHGDSGCQQEGSFLFKTDGWAKAKDAAEEDLMRDAERVLGLVPCPTCKRRNPRYVRWAMIRAGAWLVLAAIAFVLLGADYWFVAAVPGVIGLAQAWRERSRFKRASVAHISKLLPGVPPGRTLAGTRPEPPKPAPAPAKPATIRAVAAPPIEKVEQRGPDDEPAFLRKKD
jgi:hypothetical protein